MPEKSKFRLMWLLCAIALLATITSGCWEKSAQSATATPGSATTSAPAAETVESPSATPVQPDLETGDDYPYPYPENATITEPATQQAYPEQ